MKNKKPKDLATPRYVECELIPITDPDEIAALERRVRKAEKAMAAAERANGKKTKPRKGK
jgi:hypothetical protein